MTAPRISLCMITKNEEKYLGACLASVQGAVDEICLVDTGSTDHTLDIARAFDAKLGFFPWNDRFDDARNAAVSMATGDWIVVLDADERLATHHAQLVRKVAAEAPADCEGVFFICVSGTPGPVDESPVLRMFRNKPHIRFEGRVHEEVGMTIQKAGGALGYSQVVIIHDGYQQAVVDEKQKWARNERLLLLEDAERPDSGFTKYNLGHMYLVKGEPEKAAPYFADSLRLSNQSHIYWSRLVEEARIAGVVIGGRIGWPCLPIDPVTQGKHPDPLMRAA